MRRWPTSCAARAARDRRCQQVRQRRRRAAGGRVPSPRAGRADTSICRPGTRTGDLLDRIVALLPERRARAADGVVRLAVIGRPNVGKSSLVNRFLGEERVIVSEWPARPATRSTCRCWSTAAADPRRHRRDAPPVEGRRLGRVLHDAALPACCRAGRRRARGLRRQRWRHRAGPARRRARDEGRLRDASCSTSGTSGAPRGCSISTTSARGWPKSCVCARAC